MTANLDHIAFRVENLEKALDFYVGIMGCEIADRFFTADGDFDRALAADAQIGAIGAQLDAHRAVPNRFPASAAPYRDADGNEWLSAGVVQDISALIEVYRGYPQDADQTKIKQIAQNRLGLVIDFLPLADMPPPGPKPTTMRTVLPL